MVGGCSIFLIRNVKNVMYALQEFCLLLKPIICP